MKRQKYKIQSVLNFKNIYKIYCIQNSIDNYHTNKSLKTSINNNLLNRITDVINKINYN